MTWTALTGRVVRCGESQWHIPHKPPNGGEPTMRKGSYSEELVFFVVAACGWPLSWPVLWSRQIRHKRQHLETRSQLLWSRQVRHKRQHLETVSFTGTELKPTVVVATGAAQHRASTSGDGELHRDRTEANCCHWSRQVRHRRQHLETVSFTGREPKPTVVIATGAAKASTSRDGELHRERTEANCCHCDRCGKSVNI